MSKIEPNHDFLGLIGIEFDDGLRLYGVTPRFWYNKYNHDIQYLEGSSVRILRQKEIVDLGNDEEHRQVEKNIQQIKSNYGVQNILEEESQENEDSSTEIEVPLGEFNPEEVLTSLFNLCEFYRKNQEQEILVDIEFSSNSLPLFLYEKFVEKLEENTKELRRTYRPVTEPVGAVRGKITTRGMMMIVAQPSPRIECEFEKFDIQAPLYRVMMSTLDVIRTSRLPSGFKFLDERFQNICRRSANLRMNMMEIPSFPLGVALRECKKFRRYIPRMFKQFENILPLAEQILRKESEKLKEEQSEKNRPWWHITAPSSKLWELLLEKSMEKDSEYHVEKQQPLYGPWKGTGQKNIDLCIQLPSNENAGAILVDAKYAKRKDTPSSGYQYQQFFYAVAWAAAKKPPRAMVLAHPAFNRSEEIRTSDSEDMEEQISKFINNSPIPFKIWTLRFPQPEDLRTTNLDHYFSATNARMKELIKETNLTEQEI